MKIYTKHFPLNFKIDVVDFKYEVNSEDKAVVAIMKIALPTFVTQYSRNYIVKGVARLKPGDIFNAEIGKKVAKAKVERAAFSLYRVKLREYRKDLREILKATEVTYNKMCDYITKQEDYIKSF